MPLIKLEGHVDNNSSNELTISTDTYTSLKIRVQYFNLERVFGLPYLSLSVNLCDLLILIKFLLHVQASLKLFSNSCCFSLPSSLTDFVLFIYSSHKSRKQQRLMLDEK